MDIAEVRQLLEANGLAISGEKRLRNGLGSQLRVKNGAVVNVWNNGNVNVQGKNREVVEAALPPPIRNLDSGTAWRQARLAQVIRLGAIMA